MYEAHVTPISSADQSILRRELLERRHKLEAAAARSHEGQLVELLDAVDAALHRIDHGAFGICSACDAAIERELLLDDPLARICIECLSHEQRRALEHDLSLASKIQQRLLPEREIDTHGWEAFFHYEPHGTVSGDFYDVIEEGDSTLVIVGDVSGKGVSAAMIMSHLSAVFRGLSGTGLTLVEVMERANRQFSPAIPAGSFATLVAMCLRPDGRVELSNAGHVPPLVQNGRIHRLPPDGVPLGLFCRSSYTSQQLRLENGERLILATDGLIESTNDRDEEYGLENLSSIADDHLDDNPQQLTERIVADVARFRDNRQAADDTTLMVLRRAG